LAGEEKRSTQKASSKMKLFLFAVFCLAGQMVAAHTALNIINASEVVFLVSMAVSCHLVIEICKSSNLERCRGFFAFFTVYAVAELYLFALALFSTVDMFYPAYSWLYDQGRGAMFTLTMISLLAGGITPILNKTGRMGDAIGRFIDYCYSAVLRLPYHNDRG